jgi:hypothetical protein
MLRCMRALHPSDEAGQRGCAHRKGFRAGVAHWLLRWVCHADVVPCLCLWWSSCPQAEVMCCMQVARGVGCAASLGTLPCAACAGSIVIGVFVTVVDVYGTTTTSWLLTLVVVALLVVLRVRYCW